MKIPFTQKQRESAVQALFSVVSPWAFAGIFVPPLVLVVLPWLGNADFKVCIAVAVAWVTIGNAALAIKATHLSRAITEDLKNHFSSSVESINELVRKNERKVKQAIGVQKSALDIQQRETGSRFIGLENLMADIQETHIGIVKSLEDTKGCIEVLSGRLKGQGEELKVHAPQIEILSMQLEEMGEIQLQLQDTLQETRGQLGQVEQAQQAGLESTARQGNAIDTQIQTLTQQLNTLVSQVQTSGGELEKLLEYCSRLEQSFAGTQERIGRQATLLEEMEKESIDLQNLVMNNRKILHKTKAINYRHIYVHPRNLIHKDVLRLEEFWLPALGLELSSSALGYIAHKICAIEDQCIGRLATSVQDAVLRVLLARSFSGNPLRFMEIGTLFGISIGTIYENCRGFHKSTKFITIDPLDGFYGQGNDKFTGMPVSQKTLQYNLRQCEIENRNIQIVPYLSTDKQALDAVEGMTVDILVIDGDHTYDGVAFDFMHYSGFVADGGFLLFDDYALNTWPDVARFVDEKVKGASGWEFVGADWNSIVFRRVPEPVPNVQKSKPRRKTTRRKKRT